VIAECERSLTARQLSIGQSAQVGHLTSGFP
jgi:hypothetical protein